ncbi:SDR family NAD(P)-dependent oxidoreductase [Streptomyces fragilis]|uniref:SDR family NAD(P)-dependent oxidoreductase n=1 Tax=Streptomyces fragilis TaxID=67301 RepID=UPI0024DEDA28|nr:SDR family NAD(P)-dependent oxidoreductase [Streptomyces fragilis]
MSSVFVTGSAQGIGHETARALIDAGHRVVVHARDDRRAAELRASLPGAAAVLTGDLASLDSTRALASAAAQAGPFDVVIHNAGAVSYTHLDVYKRQTRVWAAAPPSG